MIDYYTAEAGRLAPVSVDPARAIPPNVIWMDVIGPTREEELALERALGIDIPTREEMAEIETSSRLYRVDGTLYMTAVVVARSDSRDPATVPVTFVLSGALLITVRYDTPQSIEIFRNRCESGLIEVHHPAEVAVGLLATIIDRAADILERVGGDLDRLSREIFRHSNAQAQGRQAARAGGRIEDLIDDVGHAHDVVFRLRESLQTLQRLSTFLRSEGDQGADGDLGRKVIALEQDVTALREYDTFLSGKVDFLLNATLGLVGMQQNNIVKLFSVIAVVFMPPTLVASIYGMNFEHMPELGWHLGYPWALLLMVLSAIGPYMFFKWRKWL
ncbi:magnesium transporter CorA family protein [Arenibaculum pallidiluteum]|uniref:magnesium transporter CorA family protein n=1 Tax=Arenibaculum pallidiluteum TaxID=2812559 RepID=UPI001A95F35E|nr:magnesium transporter CorA family protein [Arenibaculum pallidiluteum]